MAFTKKPPVPGAPVKKPLSAAAKAAKAKATKAAKITFDAPADMKPCFIEFMFRTQADGLLGPQFKAIRVKGQWTNPDAKRFDMIEYDAKTVAAMMARIGARTFSAGVAKRLPALTAFRLIIRVGKRAADDTILSSVKSIAKQVKSAKTGKPLWKELADTTDPVRRKLRSIARFLPGAFVSIQLPPSGRKPKEEADE